MNASRLSMTFVNASMCPRAGSPSRVRCQATCSGRDRASNLGYIHTRDVEYLAGPVSRSSASLFPSSSSSLPSSPSSSSPHRAVVSVCKNKHCCRRGANELYMRLKDEALVRRDVDIDVRASSCLKQCKRGPAAHVSVFFEGEERAREVICVNVGSHDVEDLAVAYTMLE